MYTQRAATAICKDLKIPPCLCRFHCSECVFLAGDGNIVLVVAGDLQKYTAVGSTFVCLAGGMQETRTKAEASGNLFSVPYGVADLLQARFMRRVHLNVGQ